MHISTITGWSKSAYQLVITTVVKKRTESEVRGEKNQFCMTLGNKSLFHSFTKKGHVKGEDIEK